MENAKKGFKYELVFKGVFGRNRSVKLKVVPLIPFSEEPKPYAEVLPLAKAALASLGPKGGACYVAVEEKPIEVGEEGGFAFESYMIFTEKKLYAERLASPEEAFA